MRSVQVYFFFHITFKNTSEELISQCLQVSTDPYTDLLDFNFNVKCKRIKMMV